MRDYDQAVQEEYDAIVDAAGEEGIKRTDALEQLTPIIEAGVADGSISLPDVAKSVKTTVEGLDDRRSTGASFRKLREEMLGNPLWSPDDHPLLTQSWSLGSGLRKSGRYMGFQDIDDAMELKRAHSVAAVNAYDAEATAANDIKRALRGAGVEFLGDYQ